MLTRLDRIYFFHNGCAQATRELENHTIRRDNPWSDYNLVDATLEFGSGQIRKNPWKMSTTLLEEASAGIHKV